VCERTLKTLRDGRELPDSYASNVVEAALVTGDTVLFQRSAVEAFFARRPTPVDHWLRLREELEKGGLRLLVVLVPGKYRVYRALLLGPESRFAAGDGDYIDRLEAALVNGGVPVLNLTRVLSEESPQALRRREYLYWRDDIHWTPLGTEIAAQALAARLQTDATDSVGD
jgi:hypothetical protein